MSNLGLELLLPVALFVCSCCGSLAQDRPAPAKRGWTPVGLSGGGGMFTPAISPADPNLMMINCDMSGAYISEDGGHNWRIIHHAQLRSDTGCRPAFHPANPDIIYASSGGKLKISRDRGRTFAPIGNLKESLHGEIAICPSNPDLMLAGARSGKCWLSRDAGATWAACSGPAGRVLGFHFEDTGKGIVMFAATDKGIWRSDDRGQTWTEKTQGLPWTEIQGFAGGSAPKQKVVLLYCTVRSKEENGAFKGGVYRSRDRGETWESAMGQGLNMETKPADQYAYGPIAQYQQLLTTDAKPTTVYVLNTATGFHPPHFDTVYRSDDAGQTWRATYFMDPRFERYNVGPDYVTASSGQSYKGGEAPFGVAVCNTDPQRILLVRNEAHITHNGGANWFCGSTYPAAEQKPGLGSAWACNGLVVTTTWHYYIDPFEPNRHYICYTDLGWARSLDAGKSWIWWDPKSWAPWRNTCYELAFDPEVPGKIWGAFSDVHDIPNDNIISERHGNKRPGGVCLSTNFGASWKPAGTGLPPKAVTSVVLDPRSANGARTLYAGVFEAGVYKSTDDGKTWVLKKNGLGAPENMRVYRVWLHADGTLFAIICAKRPGGGKPLMAEGVGLYRSPDAGESWEKINASQPLLYPKDFSVHPRDSKRILVGACDVNWENKQGGLYLTEDGGTTWRRIGREGPQTFGGYFHPEKEGWIYMTLTEDAPGAGLWLTRDNGRSWEPFADLPFANIQRVEFDSRDHTRMRVTTFGGSVWEGPAEPADRPLQGGGWEKYKGNPVIGGKYGTCFDVSVLREEEDYRMWLSWRPKQSIALVESKDGLSWSEPPTVVLGPRKETGWEDDINRPVVLKRNGKYHMWYTGQARGHSAIGYAVSQDGIAWERMSLTPVLAPESPWEKVAVMCPHVTWDEDSRLYRMWYSAGDQYEPDAVGYATSTDGLKWKRPPDNPVFRPDPSSHWEQHKVTAVQVEKHGDWYLMFYIGFRDVDHAQIGLARSRDGLSNWERHPSNPIVRPDAGQWDHDACYKPYAIFDGAKWLLWYNGRHGSLEQIGVAIHQGEDLGFAQVPRTN